MIQQRFIRLIGFHFALVIATLFGLIVLSQGAAVALSAVQAATATPVPKPTRKPAVTIGPTLPKDEIHKFNAFGYVLIIERSEDKSGQFFLRTSNQSKRQRVGVNQPLLVSGRFLARSVSQSLSDDISNAVLETGKLYAAILPGIDPFSDGIELVFVTRGRFTWCGLDFATTQPAHQLVFVARLHQQTDQLTWRPNVTDDLLQKLEPIETRGWLETSFSSVQIIDTNKGAPTPIPVPMKRELVLHTTERAYSLEFLDNVTSRLGSDDTLQYGDAHQYLVHGYKCNMPGGDSMFSPAQRIQVNHIEKIR